MALQNQQLTAGLKMKEIKVDENEVMTLKEVKALRKEMARIKEENEILHQRRALAKSYGHICNKN